MRILQCKLTTIEAMLGTASNNKELHSEFIASHAPDAPSREEEIAVVGVDEVIEKGMTVFSRNKDGKAKDSKGQQRQGQTPKCKDLRRKARA